MKNKNKDMLNVNRPTEVQGVLFEFLKDVQFDTSGAARNYYGAAVENVVCKALQLNPIPINGNYEINFDAFKRDYFYEIKSVRAKGKVVLYDWRMEKEKPFTNRLLYIFGVHQIKEARSIREIYKQLQSRGIKLVVNKAGYVHDKAMECPLKTVAKTKNNIGYTRKGYEEGYRNLPIKGFRFGENGVQRNIKLYNYKIPIYIDSSSVKLLTITKQWEI